MKTYRFELLVILSLLLAAILIGGCTTPAPKKQDNAVGIQDEEMGDTASVYILGTGDTIDITVYREKTSEFIVGAGDTLNINVYRHSDLDRSVRVDAFGVIMLPLIGDVQVAGRGVSELRDKIQQRLSKYLVDPQVTINMLPIEDLKMNDLSLSPKIDPTGVITFPLIGDVQVAGRDVSELRDEIQERLSKYLVNPQVTINVSEVQSKKYHVFGEIKSPGSFTLDRKTLALEGISRAGGFTLDANQKNVLLLRADEGLDRVNALNLNIKGMDKDGELDLKVYLQNGDIIYVLPSFIANIEQFMVRLDNILRPFLTTAQIIWFGDRAIDVVVSPQ